MAGDRITQTGRRAFQDLGIRGDLSGASDRSRPDRGRERAARPPAREPVGGVVAQDDGPSCIASRRCRVGSRSSFERTRSSGRAMAADRTRPGRRLRRSPRDHGRADGIAQSAPRSNGSSAWSPDSASVVVAVLYISHHLDEIFEIAETVTVLRDGERVFCGPIDGPDVRATDREDVRARSCITSIERARIGRPRLRSNSITCRRGARLRDVSCRIDVGEVVGFTGGNRFGRVRTRSGHRRRRSDGGWLCSPR